MSDDYHYGNSYANVIDVVYEHGPVGIAEVAERCQIPYDTARVYLHRGVKRGALVRPERGIFAPLGAENPTRHAHATCAAEGEAESADRIADALERIADALERPRTDRLPELLRAALDAKPCDDRTCTDRDHWAPLGRIISHGSTPTTCVHGQDHPDSLTCEYRCAATMPGHWCTRREHADDRHVWAMSDAEAERHLREEDWFADPLDESDHRPRHNRYGGHVYRHGPEHWHDYGLEDGPCDMEPAMDDPVKLTDFPGPLTFCGCDDARGSDRHVAPAKCVLSEPHQGPHLWVDVVARSLETGEYVPMSVTARMADPLDESDHRPRHFGRHRHITLGACGRWHSSCDTGARCDGERHLGSMCTLAWWASYDPLTFCDCDDATIEAENGATD